MSAEKKCGGLAEYVTIDVQHVHKIPETLSHDVAACMESVATAWHAVKRANFTEGDTALILGGGPTALFILRVLRSIAPTSFILVSDTSPARRSLALKHGASEVLNPSNTHFGATGVIHKATAGFGVHAVFDTVGTQSTVDSALVCLRTGGTLVNMAVWKKNVMVNMNFLFKEITVTGHDNVYPEVIEALANGQIQGIQELITERIQIEDVVKKGPYEPPPPPPEEPTQDSSEEDKESKDEALVIPTANPDGMTPVEDPQLVKKAECEPEINTEQSAATADSAATVGAQASSVSFTARLIGKAPKRLSSIRTKFVEVME
ncbi:hypothetical protein NP233_g12811 [Leucocoprinus birnbaumii]|uniref:Alcohol dehydrogenase-like C-terminal domain-containing protein n=1 Tax=Leucocoprinus birnbaumii TaxID=56174 RepID=A0AAD5VJE4_9AGAR|nr:hypothetical protein NP233_g12811 [Leucocoprinus birnbaumii]